MDTELLAERAILRARAAGEGARVLDLCAGSGCVGLAVAANVPACRVVLADLSEEALKICKQNVRRNDLNARVTCMLADAKEKPDPVLWDFDVIVWQPAVHSLGRHSRPGRVGAGLRAPFRSGRRCGRAGFLPLHRLQMGHRPPVGRRAAVRSGDRAGPGRGVYSGTKRV